MLRSVWVVVGFLVLLCQFARAEEPADTLTTPPDTLSISKEPSIIYVIPAGPVAGSFTDQSRIQVEDTVAGWAKILVEGWVPVEKVVGRMGENAVVLQSAGEVEKPKKAKVERPQCIAKTAKGKQCTRRAVPGSKKCWQHSQ